MQHAEVQSCHLDWTAEDPGVGRFDVVLACDVIYEHAAVAAIANLIPKLLNTETGTFILADPESRTRHHRSESMTGKSYQSTSTGVVLTIHHSAKEHHSCTRLLILDCTHAVKESSPLSDVASSQHSGGVKRFVSMWCLLACDSGFCLQARDRGSAVEKQEVFFDLGSFRECTCDHGRH